MCYEVNHCGCHTLTIRYFTPKLHMVMRTTESFIRKTVGVVFPSAFVFLTTRLCTNHQLIKSVFTQHFHSPCSEFILWTTPVQHSLFSQSKQRADKLSQWIQCWDTVIALVLENLAVLIESFFLLREGHVFEIK